MRLAEQRATPDAPHVKPAIPDAWPLLRDAAQSWLDDRASTLGAALAYYTIFSVAPLALIVIGIAGTVFGEQAARGEIVSQLAGIVGREGALSIQSLLERARAPGSGMLATAIGAGVLLFGATTVFSELQSALDRVWRAPPPATPEHGLWYWLRARLLALALILAIGFLVIAAIVTSTLLAALRRGFAPGLGATAALLSRAADFAFGVALVTLAFALVYKWMPRVRVEWRDVWVGALMTSLLFNLGKTLIGLYIGTSGITTPFGAAGSLVAFVLWVYWSAQIFLFGAELTRVYACSRGSLSGRRTCAHRDADGTDPASPAVAGAPAGDDARP